MCAADVNARPDEQCLMTYVSEFPAAFLASYDAVAAAARRQSEIEAMRAAMDVARAAQVSLRLARLLIELWRPSTPMLNFAFSPLVRLVSSFKTQERELEELRAQQAALQLTSDDQQRRLREVLFDSNAFEFVDEFSINQSVFACLRVRAIRTCVCVRARNEQEAEQRAAAIKAEFEQRRRQEEVSNPTHERSLERTNDDHCVCVRAANGCRCLIRCVSIVSKIETLQEELAADLRKQQDITKEQVHTISNT